MKKQFLSLFACMAVLAAGATDTWTLGKYDYSADTLFHVTSGPGITTTGIRLSSANGANQTNIFYSTIDLTNPDLEIRGVQAKDNGDVVENVNAMGNRKNTQGNGQYIAGVNGDFFNMYGSPTRTNGHSLVDGLLYNAGVDGTWPQWASYAVVDGAKDIRILQSVNAAKTLKFPNGGAHKFYLNPDARWENYLCVYTPAKGENTGTNEWGRECQMKLVSGSIEGNDAVFEITSPWVGNCDGTKEGIGSMEIPADGYVLSGTGSGYAMMAQLKVGDKVSMGTTVSYNGNEINPTQMIGGCSMIVINGKLAPASYFSASVIPHFVSNEARTVIGYNEDRTKLIILVADKYGSYAVDENKEIKVKDAEKLSYGSSTGMVLERMGHIMLQLGCYTAMNFDGGGSSQLYNKGVGICNVPYGDTYFRPVANGLFAVSTTPVDNEIAYLEARHKNVKLAEGETYTPLVYGYNKYGVLVDNNVTDYTFAVAPELGAVEGKTFTAGAAAGSTHAVIAKGDIKCAVRVLTNGGGDYVTSGDDSAPLMVNTTYTADEPLGVDKEPIYLTERWHFSNPDLNDGWDSAVPNWESDDAVKGKSCIRFATARNGHFYTVDMKTMSIAEIDTEGNLIPLYKLPSLEGREINGVPDYYGTAISSDDAGNFLIGHLFTKTDTYRVWTIYNPKTRSYNHFEIKLPEGELSSGRIDNIGRVVGDLNTEAYAYVAPKATGALVSQKVLMLHFKGNGTGDFSNTTCEATLSPGIYAAGNGNTLTTCQPRYSTVTEMKDKDLATTFYWYSKAAGTGASNQDLFYFVKNAEEATSVNYANLWPNNMSRLNGFDTFLLKGKRYFIVHYSATAANDSGNGFVVKDENGNTVAEWNNPDYTVSGAGYNTITAIPVNEYQVNIYVYNCSGKGIAGALCTLTFGNEYEAYEPVDITPAGLNFDNYADGDEFKIYSTETDRVVWSGPANFYKNNHPTAFEDNGQLTSFLYRGCGPNLNNQATVDANIQPMVKVRKVSDLIGQALVINEQYSPAAARFGWEGKGFGGNLPQFSFYVNNHDIKAKTDQKHYIRVRLVYNVLFRGCHYLTDVKDNKDVKVVKGIYATHEGNWVVPGLDHELAGQYADKGTDFAKWVDETGNFEDIPENPEVYVPVEGDVDEWDPTHTGGVMTEGHSAYLLNSDRYRVYEFDTYMDKPSASTLSVQFNIHDRNITYIVKEIKFTDLGTDEADATLLGRRNLSWIYCKDFTSGVEDVAVEPAEDSEAPAEYYNLQGIRVMNPDNGIYIVRRGNKTTKEYIR